MDYIFPLYLRPANIAANVVLWALATAAQDQRGVPTVDSDKKMARWDEDNNAIEFIYDGDDTMQVFHNGMGQQVDVQWEDWNSDYAEALWELSIIEMKKVAAKMAEAQGTSFE
eukprot:CAMPEP_0182564808 /NCGR_PEP_ID=MMETSP1324-20130603/6681_1 /TAXON_ID=236786 /ORGANISM="Florenciella sp., Strain RCC1587" /LENGTH=112 /DNA_ID=CAMNT_0024778345 /DNA_START=98 /DNA_END=436 /DNA_ORIENTATION=+